MEFDPKKILEKLLQNKKVAKIVEKHNLTFDQQIEAIPILYEIKNEPKDSKTHTDLEITSLGGIERVIIYDNLNNFEKNILTQSIENIPFKKNESLYKTTERKILVNKMSKYVLSKSKEQKGLYIHGKMGVGKSFICKKIVRKLAEKQNKVGFINLPNLHLTLRNSFNDPERYMQIVSILKSVDFLFIDDIGSETIAPWFRDDFLFTILNFRGENKKTTFFTSNHSLKDLEVIERKTQGSKYLDFNKSKRLLDRIDALSETFELKGNNYRLSSKK